MKQIVLEPAQYYRLYSDIHQDFYVSKKFTPTQLWEPEPLDEDSESVLILAGDIWHAKKPFIFANYSWYKKMSERFKYVFVVLGNHDFWGGSFPNEYTNFERYKKQFVIDNLYLLQYSTILLGDYKFIGSTLWTSLGSRSVDVIEQFNKCNNDLKYMRWQDPRYPSVYKHISAKQFIEAFNKSKSYIFENATRDYAEQSIVVVTHHPPSTILVTDPEMTNIDFEIDTNNLDELIKASQIDIWMHGHNHQSGKKLIGNTQIIANTVGYKSSKTSDLNQDYNPWHQEAFVEKIDLENKKNIQPKCNM